MFDKYTSDIASFSLRFVWCVSEYVLFRVAFVAGVVFDVIKEFSAAGGGQFFSLATQWPSPSGGGFFVSRAMQVKGSRIKLIHWCRGIPGADQTGGFLCPRVGLGYIAPKTPLK